MCQGNGVSVHVDDWAVKSVADPGFPRCEGANPPGLGWGWGVCQHKILPTFTKNCMKLK